MNKKFVGLIILDGYGINKSKLGNAVKIAKPFNINKYFKKYPYTTLEASGEYVGLPKNQNGNSEVGHLNIGAGRVVNQSLQKINISIEDKSFFKNKEILQAIKHAKQNKSTLHLLGLSSSGGVHSHINHLYTLIDFAVSKKVEKILIHFITDGRDVLRTSGYDDLSDLIKYISKYPQVEIASVMGRMYAMDREKNFDRTEIAYNVLVNAQCDNYSNTPLQEIKKSYDMGVYDEFLKPIVVVKGKKPVGKIMSGDSIIFYNFREDRARQLTQAIIEKDFTEFKRKKINNLFMTTFTQYDKTFLNTHIAFPKKEIAVNLSSVVSKAGMKQFKITETTKYAHVTYFLNGGIEKPYKNEERFLIDTIKTERFDDYPQMRAKEITEKAIEEIKTNKYSMMVLNYSNPDMLGHTGNLKAAVESIKLLNVLVKQLVDVILEMGGVAILTADHGNAEEMLDNNGNVLTDHTTNLVPFAIVGNDLKKMKLKNGVLGNIAPTIIDLLGIEKPKEFEFDSLIIKK